MLHSYRFRNHYSFRQAAGVSFVLDGKAPDNDLSFLSPLGYRLSKVLGVFGSNGSGKTNLLKPLAFLDWFLRESFRAPTDMPIPLQAHFFCESQESEFELTFEALGSLWRYELVVTPDRVLREALFRKTGRYFNYLFTREHCAAEGNYAVKQKGFGFSAVEARKVGERVSLISAALQYQVELARMIMDSLQLQTNVHALGRAYMGHDRVLEASREYAGDAHMALQMSEMLNSWDLGLSGVEVRKQSLRDAQNVEREVYVPWGIHASQGRTAELPLAFESSGTQSAFVLLAHLLPTLASGGIAVIDELENDLHPEMLTPVLDLFFNPNSNPRNAQLVFTCHATPILNQLSKGQIVLVEKDELCESRAYRLDEIKGVRADDNFYAKYMAGAYGAVPRL